MTPEHLEAFNMLQKYIMRLEAENWALKQALGYPIPADKEMINNPWKCGTCDAMKAENANLQAALKYWIELDAKKS